MYPYHSKAFPVGLFSLFIFIPLSIYSISHVFLTKAVYILTTVRFTNILTTFFDFKNPLCGRNQGTMPPQIVVEGASPPMDNASSFENASFNSWKSTTTVRYEGKDEEQKSSQDQEKFSLKRWWSNTTQPHSMSSPTLHLPPKSNQPKLDPALPTGSPSR